MFSGPPNYILYAAYKVVATFSLDQAGEKSKAGTGFFIRNRSGKICLVTNRHLMDLGYAEGNGAKYRGARLKSLAVEGFVAPNGNVNEIPTAKMRLLCLSDLNTVSFARNYNEDIACVVDPRPSDGTSPECRIDYFLDFSELATDQWINDSVSVCDLLAYPGFPPWHDQLAERPIIRIGWISSDPRTDYSDESSHKGRRIAYEGFSFGGSSGSPIFAMRKGLTAGPGIAVSGYRESRLIGINAGHYFAERSAHSGISYFVKSSAILEVVNHAG